VTNILPKYIVVKNIRSAANMDFKCSAGPFKMPKLPMNINEPQVNESANFCGLMASIGTPTKKARAKKSADRNNRAQKTYIMTQTTTNTISFWMPHEIVEIAAYTICSLRS
jgi:hypothetical protein